MNRGDTKIDCEDQQYDQHPSLCYVLRKCQEIEACILFYYYILFFVNMFKTNTNIKLHTNYT